MGIILYLACSLPTTGHLFLVALHEQAKDVERLKFRLSHKSVKIRQGGVYGCFDYETLPAPLIPLVLKCLADDDATLRELSAECLGRPPGENTPSFVGVLLQAYKHEKSWKVRKAIVASLARIREHTADAISLLIGVVADPESYALGNGTLEFYAEDFVDPFWCEGTLAAHALTRIGVKSIEPLLKIVEQPRNTDLVRRTALAAIQPLSQKGRVSRSSLITLTNDRDTEIRRIAVRILGGSETPLSLAARKALSAALEDDNVGVRIAAAQQLVRADPTNVTGIPVLVAYARSGTFEDRKAAFFALRELGPKALPALPTLRRLLKAPHSSIRYFAVLGCGTIGPGAKSAVADLKQLAKSDPDLASIVEVVIQEITAE